MQHGEEKPFDKRIAMVEAKLS